MFFFPLSHLEDAGPRSSSGNLAKLAAMRRASSLVSSLAAERPTGFVLEIDIGERLPVVVAHDEAGVCPLDGPGRREAAGRRFHLLVERRNSFTRRMA